MRKLCEGLNSHDTLYASVFVSISICNIWNTNWKTFIWDPLKRENTPSELLKLPKYRPKKSILPSPQRMSNSEIPILFSSNTETPTQKRPIPSHRQTRTPPLNDLDADQWLLYLFLFINSSLISYFFFIIKSASPK